MAITLPYRFDTSSVWRTIIKGAFALNGLIVFGILYSLLLSRPWTTALGLTLVELVVLVFTRLFVRFQTGSVRCPVIRLRRHRTKRAPRHRASWTERRVYARPFLRRARGI